MKDGKTEKTKPNIFFVAYTRLGTATEKVDPAKRARTFSFNGGPGSASIWLHMGALGPKRVVMKANGESLPPPYEMAENEHSWLDETDHVLIDPVSTGYSRAAAGEDPKPFHGSNEEVASVGDFIRLYTTRHRRWASPKFLVGESYGTTRASALSDYLQERCGL
jgi:carboxypeptidase C (cathepsin A)